jgi:hypothetical protein
LQAYKKVNVGKLRKRKTKPHRTSDIAKPKRKKDMHKARDGELERQQETTNPED